MSQSRTEVTTHTGHDSRNDFRTFDGEGVVDVMETMDFPRFPEGVVKSRP
ncbi:hypothetical protein [Nocardia nova]|nr:hypothetical protein [Nocardia nova]